MRLLTRRTLSVAAPTTLSVAHFARRAPQPGTALGPAADPTDYAGEVNCDGLNLFRIPRT